MKISKLFHTLYGCLMALPIFVIPIFAININQKSVEPISIEIQEKEEVIFNQNVDFNTCTNNAFLEENVINDYALQINGSPSWILANRTNTIQGHKYLLKWENDFVNPTGSGVPTFTIYASQFNGNIDFTTTTSGSIIKQCTNNYLIIYVNTYNGYVFDNYSININVFDLTEMYGVNNEPTIEEFNQTFQYYYDYIQNEEMLVNKPIPTIYDNTDIGSQFLYSIYKPVNDYFNFKDFMGLGSLYDWIQLNIFSGTNSLVFFVLFNLFTYWIFVSFFWLIFDVLMYVPSLVHKMLDKARLE